MASLKSVYQSVSWSIGEFFENLASSVANTFGGIVGGIAPAFEGFLEGDTVGINVNEIPNMQAAIKTYVEQLQDHLNTMAVNATTDEAFKGSYATAVRDFVQAVNVSCYAIISHLNAFSDKLTEVAAAYAEADTSLASSINNQSEEMRSKYTAYESSSGNSWAGTE